MEESKGFSTRDLVVILLVLFLTYVVFGSLGVEVLLTVAATLLVLVIICTALGCFIWGLLQTWGGRFWLLGEAALVWLAYVTDDPWAFLFPTLGSIGGVVIYIVVRRMGAAR